MCAYVPPHLRRAAAATGATPQRTLADRMGSRGDYAITCSLHALAVVMETAQAACPLPISEVVPAAEDGPAQRR